MTEQTAGRLSFQSAGAVRKNRPERSDVSVMKSLVELARNIAALDEHFLKTADAGLLRATIDEYRTQARAAVGFCGND